MRNRLKEESGSITVITAVFLASAILLGTVALAVDAGIIYAERRTVANSAQSAALALAKECIERPTDCATSNSTQSLANANSPDGLTLITEICIDGKLSNGSPCQTPSLRQLDCAPVPTSIKKYVRVRAQSQSNTPGIGVQTFFSRDNSHTLKACAQVRWGNAASAPVYSPFAVSICDWAKQQALPRTLVEFKTNDSVTSCNFTFTDMSGQTFTRSGISGWAALDLLSASLPASARSNVSCPNPATDQPAYLQIGHQLSQITRDQSSQNYCGNSDLKSKMNQWLNQDLYIPLISTAKLTGNATVHTIEAFAAFKLLGYSLQKGNGSASDSGGSIPSGDWCAKNTNCIYGEFKSTISPNSEISNQPGTPNVGLQAIELF